MPPQELEVLNARVIFRTRFAQSGPKIPLFNRPRPLLNIFMSRRYCFTLYCNRALPQWKGGRLLLESPIPRCIKQDALRSSSLSLWRPALHRGESFIFPYAYIVDRGIVKPPNTASTSKHAKMQTTGGPPRR